MFGILLFNNKLDTTSIICLCYNQASFVREALDSAIGQIHANVELIIVDDGSTDGSKEIIRDWLTDHPNVPFINIGSRIGNCAAFNCGWRKSSGDFVIDLAADDILSKDRVNEGLKQLRATGAGVHHCDAELINESGVHQSYHSDQFKGIIPEGNLYIDLVSRYLVCPPTMMIRREVLEDLGGYDESLTFEDFDFWVRSSRNFEYCYTAKVLVKKREVKNSHATSQDKFMNNHQRSILKVCWKILSMNQTVEEGRALRKRCWHEIGQCIKKGNLGLILDYLSILKQS